MLLTSSMLCSSAWLRNPSMHSLIRIDRSKGKLSISILLLVTTDRSRISLIRLSSAWPELRELAWSTDRLHDELATVCRQLGWTITSLAVRSDIDTVSDLLATRHELANDERSARRDLREWISKQTDELTELGGGSRDAE